MIRYLRPCSCIIGLFLLCGAFHFHAYGNEERLVEPAKEDFTNTFWGKQHPYEALLQAEKARKAAEKERNTPAIIRALLSEVEILAYITEVESGQLLAKRAMQLAEATKNDTLRAKSGTAFGRLTLLLRDTNTAYVALKQASIYQQKLGLFDEYYANELRICQIQYFYFKNPKKGLEGLKRVKLWAQLARSNSIYIDALLVEGAIQYQEKNLDVSRQALSEALSLTKLSNETDRKIEQLITLANYALKVKSLSVANEASNQAVSMAKAMHLPFLVRTAIVALALSDEALSDPTSAFNTIKVGIKLSDSLQSDKKKNLIKISNLLVTSSSFLKENEALREKGELHSQRFTFQNVLITLSLLVGALLGAMLFMAKHANRRAGKLADILKAQNDELMAYKEDIQNLNNKLETEMAERTRILTQRTRQLLDYANYNSHMVRGPLARILGLNYLIDHTKNDREVRNYIEMLKESAFEMDEALRLINRKLELQEADYMKTIAIGQEKGANT